MARFVLLSGALMVLWMLFTAQESSAAPDGSSAAKVGSGLKVATTLTEVPQRVSPSVASTVGRVTEAALKPAIQSPAPTREDPSATPEEPVQSRKPASANKIVVVSTVRTEAVPAVRKVSQTSVTTVDEVRVSAGRAASVASDALGLKSVTDPLVRVADSVTSSLVTQSVLVVEEVLDVTEELPVPDLASPPVSGEWVTPPGDASVAAVPVDDARRDAAGMPAMVASEQVPASDGRAALGWTQVSARSSGELAVPSASALSGHGAPFPIEPTTPANPGATLSATSSPSSQGNDVAGEGTQALLVPSTVSVSMTSGPTQGQPGPQLLPGFSPE